MSVKVLYCDADNKLIKSKNPVAYSCLHQSAAVITVIISVWTTAALQEEKKKSLADVSVSGYTTHGQFGTNQKLFHKCVPYIFLVSLLRFIF